MKVETVKAEAKGTIRIVDKDGNVKGELEVKSIEVSVPTEEEESDVTKHDD